jgi:hypothetical protein
MNQYSTGTTQISHNQRVSNKSSFNNNPIENRKDYMHIKGEEEIYADEYDISDHGEDNRHSHSLNR